MSGIAAQPVPRLSGELALAPQATAAMQSLERALKVSGLEPSLLLLMKLRASQINGCAFCIDMHAPYFLATTADPMRLHQLTVWRESPLFSRGPTTWCRTRGCAGVPLTQPRCATRAHGCGARSLV